MRQYRHGDVLISEVKNIPSEAKALTHTTLAEGEVTGHAHRVEPERSVLYEKEGVKFLDVTEEFALLSHEEHHTLELPRGYYEIKIQREYDDENEWRKVAD